MKQQILVFNDVYNESAARSQADVEKTGAFGLAAKVKLWDRPKEADVTLVSSEKRFEPFWNIKAGRQLKFDVKTTYTVKASNPYALSTTVLDQRLDIPVNRNVVLTALEYCEKRVELSEYFPGFKKSSANKTPPEYVAKFNYQPLTDEAGLMLIPPEVSAVFIAQEIKKRLMEPVEAATMHEDALELHELLLYYRPVYAFEYAWRDKRGVVEIDALTGNVNKEGMMLVNKARGMMTRDTLVDIGAELANALVPGGGVIVKLVGVATKPQN
jgi:hypothetical protein